MRNAERSAEVNAEGPASRGHGGSEERPPLVSVVIPVLNGEEHIGTCLDALRRVDYPKERYEILVVDNGSTDRTADVLSRYPVRALYEPRRGPAQARNRGIAAARGDIVAFTDADCVPSTGWLRELVRGFDHGDIGGVAGEILPYPPKTPAEKYAARIRHLSPVRYMSREILPFAVTANLAFRREVFGKVGLLDVDSPRGGESTDFCTRFCRGTGQRLELAPRAIVLHRHRSTAWELFKQQLGYGRGHAYLYIKYRDEIPWGWRETVNVYRDLGGSAASLLRNTLGFLAGRTSRDDLDFASFELLKKTALRLGFAREALSRGRVYL
jgi:glycosyltransferase involved in cell wall biosynthesis